MRPDASASDPALQRLSRLRTGLIQLHKRLLDSERAAYERDIARVTSANQLLDLVLHDPWFAWLRELSQLVVLIDQTIDGDGLTTDLDATRLITQARALLSPSEEATGFRRRYFDAMQRDPDAVLAHRDVLRVLAGVAEG